MKERITLCGDNCLACPRYNAHSEIELKNVAELWYRAGSARYGSILMKKSHVRAVLHIKFAHMD